MRERKLILLRQLARRRCCESWPGYRHPESYFGFDFRDFVSPYTKSAGNVNAEVMIVLQDWASDDGLMKAKPDARLRVSQLGYDPKLRTNKNLERLLKNNFGLRLSDTYVTNAFPFIKSGNMSAPISTQDVRRAVEMFAVEEIRIVRPRLVLTLGQRAQKAFQEFRLPPDIIIEQLPHPAARMSLEEMDAAWGQVAIRRRTLITREMQF